ncbi:hypothetical protein IJ732_08570 [bacterium]|nr:hypothetical protein [bacterium]
MNLGLKANAVQNYINVPTSEVLKKDVVFIKEATLVSPGKGRSVTTTPSVNVGLGWGMEASFGVPVSIKFEDGKTTEKISIDAKKVFYIGSDTNRLTIGGAVAPSINMPVCPDMYIYSHATKVFPKTRTSFSVGGYMTGENHFVNSGGAILALDQGIIGNKVKGQVEWTSGYNNKSHFGVGLKYKPKDDFSIAAAMIIPMKETDNIKFQLTFSKFFYPKTEEKL